MATPSNTRRFLFLPLLFLWALLMWAAQAFGQTTRPAAAAYDFARQVELKVARDGLRPMLRAEHGRPLVIENEFVHGVGDRDLLQVKPTLDGRRGECWSWSAVVLRNVTLGTAWRTPAGAARGLHVDQFQLLGNAAQTAPIDVLFEGVRFSDTAGDPMPAGATRADTCLLQEVWLGLVVFRDVRIERGLGPIKITLRTAASGVAGVVVDDSPDLRIHVTALDPRQVGWILVRNSPGALVTAADGLVLHVVYDPPDPTLERVRRQLDDVQKALDLHSLHLSDLVKTTHDIRDALAPREATTAPTTAPATAPTTRPTP